MIMTVLGFRGSGLSVEDLGIGLGACHVGYYGVGFSIWGFGVFGGCLGLMLFMLLLGLTPFPFAADPRVAFLPSTRLFFFRLFRPSYAANGACIVVFSEAFFLRRPIPSICSSS